MTTPHDPIEAPATHEPHWGEHNDYACRFSGPHCWECGEPWPCRTSRGISEAAARDEGRQGADALLRQVGEALVAVHTASNDQDEPLVDLMEPDLFGLVTEAVAAYSSRDVARHDRDQATNLTAVSSELVGRSSDPEPTARHPWPHSSIHNPDHDGGCDVPWCPKYVRNGRSSDPAPSPAVDAIQEAIGAYYADTNPGMAGVPGRRLAEFIVDRLGAVPTDPLHKDRTHAYRSCFDVHPGRAHGAWLGED